MDKHIWSVSYPIVGEVHVEVEADTEQEAIEAGWDLTDKPEAELTWEPVEHVVQGNIFYGESNDVYAEQVD